MFTREPSWQHRGRTTNGISPLALLPEGAEGEIIGFDGGRGLRRRLAEMGFTPGTRLRVLSSRSPGPVLVDIKGSRIAVGWGVAVKVVVKQR